MVSSQAKALLLKLIAEDPEWAVNKVVELERQVMKWIDVNDKLPPQDTMVLVCQQGWITSAYWVDLKSQDGSAVIGKSWAQEKHGCSLNTIDFPITHWMPLPSLPKEK